MSISKYPITDLIIPNTPGMADLIQVPSTNTWYTIVDVTSGRGIYSSTWIWEAGLSENNIVEIRITIDGAATTLTLAGASYSRDKAGQHADPLNSFVHESPVYFRTSMKVEARVTAAANTLYGSVDYSLEV